MMGGAPSGLFGLMNPKRTAMQDITEGDYATPPFAPPQQQSEPFVWGAGGSRLTPDMIAQRSRTAQGLMAAGMDTSPVGHWTQGLARIAQALVGKSQQNRLDKATQQNMSSEQQILQSLTAGGGNDQGALAAMASPYVSDGTRDALKLQWQATHRAPVQPTEFERAVTAAGIQPGTPEYMSMMHDYATNKANPMQGVTSIDPATGDTVMRFVRPTAMGGGGPASVAPAGGAAPPATLPPDFDFGGPTQPASGTFR